MRNLLVLICLLSLPVWAHAGPNPLGGPYVFVGGGAGAQFGLDGGRAPQATFRWGPSLELGGDLGPITAAVGGDLRVPILTLSAAPLDLDVTAAVGLITPTPLVRLYLRLRGGIGWRFIKGSPAVMSVLVAPDFGVRLRVPGAKAAFQLGVAAGPRIIPGAVASSALDLEIRVGVKFP